MDKNENIFITTTLPYANGPCHVGAAFEFILADSINRHLKLKGYNTYLNIGLDQNGSKIPLKAKELNIPIKEYIDNITNTWVESCKKLNINYDNFYQTSTEKHAIEVKKIWNFFIKNGDIYQKEYTGKYCIGCESFKLEKDLIGGICNDHPNLNISEVTETNYFFKLGKYRDNLLEWIKSNPLIPNRYDELLTFINDYDEISVSRSKNDITIGIDVPNDDSQIIYIWLEALCNYSIAADNWVGWDNCDIIQTCGVDNTRFQAQIFQAFLCSLGKKNTDRILIHGTILDKEGRKMSKTLNNVVDPIEQLNKYGLDAVRYYSLAGLSTVSNSAWCEEDLINLYNSHLCNDWGNLVSRVLHLVNIREVTIDESKIDSNVRDLIQEKIDVINRLWSDLKIRDAVNETNTIAKWANAYITSKQPWSKECLDTDVILNTLHWIVCVTNKLYKPIIPDACSRIDEFIKNKVKGIAFDKIA